MATATSKYGIEASGEELGFVSQSDPDTGPGFVAEELLSFQPGSTAF